MKNWLKKFLDRLDSMEGPWGCLAYVLMLAIVVGVCYLLITFVAYIYSVSYLLGYIVMFGCFGCPLYFFTRKRWIFWLYVSIVVVIFFVLLSTQQFT